MRAARAGEGRRREHAARGRKDFPSARRRLLQVGAQSTAIAPVMAVRLEWPRAPRPGWSWALAQATLRVRRYCLSVP